MLLALVRSATAFTAPPSHSLASPLPLLHARARSTSSSNSARHASWPGLVASAASDGEGAEGAAVVYDGPDELVCALSADGSISAKAVTTTELVAETSRLQGLGGLACAALGRAVTCTILVADGIEPEEQFQVNFRGDGPLRGVLALCNGKLEARGYVGNPAVTLPPNAMGKFDVGAGVGKGTLQVVRTKNLPGEEFASPYTSFTEIKTGEVPEDINWYLADSEQREGALAAGVFVQGTDDGVDRNGKQLGGAKVLASGGWYVQLLPFADDAAVEQLQKNLAAMANRSPTTMIREGLSPEAVVNLLLDGLDPQILNRRYPPKLSESCPCCDARVYRTLRLLPQSEIDDIVEKNEEIEIKCEFCGKRYEMTPQQITDDRAKQKAAQED